jgi:hypothetical protein
MLRADAHESRRPSPICPRPNPETPVPNIPSLSTSTRERVPPCAQVDPRYSIEAAQKDHLHQVLGSNVPIGVSNNERAKVAFETTVHGSTTHVLRKRVLKERMHEKKAQKKKGH